MGNQYHELSAGSLTQDWTDITLLSTNDDWSGIPSIIGYRGDGLTTANDVNPQTVIADETTVDVNVNQTNPNTFNTGGIAEFEIANPVVALQGSGTADAPFLLIHLNTLGVTNINVSYNLRDIDGSTDNAPQQVALQYRVGTTGDFINIPAAFVADASTGPSLATLVTTVNATLPTAAENQAQVQVRIITTNATGNDEWIGVDDINVSATALPTDLFISEYVEGSSNNKAIEIFNGTGAAIDLAASGYKLEFYFNGSTTPGTTINLTGTVANGDVFVVADNDAVADILTVTDQQSTSNFFNGDDAIVLRKNGDVIDIIGQVGVDPGSEWGSGLISTADNTIRRKSTIIAGDTNPNDAFDPTLEWDGFVQNTFDGLGSHTIAGGGQSTPILTLTVTPNNFSESAGVNAAIGTVTRTGNTNNALTVTLNSNDTTEATVPTTVIIAAGQNNATFAVNAVDDALVDGSQNVTITATATGFINVTADVTVTDNEFAITKIHDIQGNGATFNAAFAGIQTIEGIVVSAFLGASQLNGFYVQEEDADVDADSTTSEAIFVYDPTGLFSGNVGDQVRITGTVGEFTSTSSGISSSLTQLSSLTNVVNLGANNLPTITNIQFPVTSVADLESYEGMLVNVSAGTGDLTVTEHFQLGRFGQVVLSATGASNQAGTDGRLEQYTQFNAPSVAGYAAYLEEIAKRRIILDDGRSTQNPDPILFGRGGNPLSASNTLRGGDTVSSITGVLDQRFEGYRIQTSTGVNFTPANSRPETAPDVGGTLKVASFNVLNFFNGNGTGGGFPTSRGADTSTEFIRQRDKIIQAIINSGTDVLGLMEIENDGYGSTSAIQDLVNGLNDIAGVGTYAFINPGISQLGTDEIAVGMIYKPGQVTPIGSAVTVANGFGQGAFDNNNRKPLAQTFSQNSTGEEFTAVVNHFKSKGSSAGGVGDADAGDGQGLSNGTRTRASEDLAAWLATNPTGTSDSDYLILGDINAYAQEDPITTLVNAGFTNLLADTTYSYVFNGQWGSLDHALANGSLAAQVTGAEKWHINADEPNVLDYNTEFKSVGQQSSLYNPNQFRSSDHDPVIVGLNLYTAQNPTNINLSESSVSENVPVGTLVGTFTTIDPNLNDSHTYSLVTGNGSIDNGAFTISDNQLLLNVSPDFESQSSYSIRVRTTDQSNLSYEQELTVTINDVEDTPSGLTIIGSHRFDVLIGWNDDDRISGLNGNDIILGLNGSDRINGGHGKDIIAGGNGADFLIYQDFSDSILGKTDLIIDFNPEEGDRFLLNNLPTAVFNAGILSKRNYSTLSAAINAAYTDVDPNTVGNQALDVNQAVFLGWNQKTYLSVNDSLTGFNANSDLVVQLLGKLDTVTTETLTPNNYFTV
ncbi:ExeM/NucH family extracellular endonuclease [Anabaena sp. UHCC 0451]|uniref:ExeM/NucH family extracellular endonuclease n=1 Tax=Anabaena sp. UHCC 0451 TaxID=2055235 RepID=UPI002B1FBAF7|nr:ExeM/NucH family extracellular endonuclease [Anabaena sp. UHCC 0451]MEA5578107.1 ExeM/NucH family extracellular endonuclease [Anabaena sp. UHCC 0451]